MKISDNLYYFTAFAILATVAVLLTKQWAHREGMRAAYDRAVQRCAEKYPQYRCEKEFAQYFDL